MQLDVSPIPYEDAQVLHKYKVPVVELKMTFGAVSMSRMYWPGPPLKDWIIVLAHSCDWNKWGSV